jgi:hypothetical protein
MNAEAEAEWRAVVEEQPEHSPAWLGLGELYLAQGKWEQLDRVVESLGIATQSVETCVLLTDSTGKDCEDDTQPKKPPNLDLAFLEALYKSNYYYDVKGKIIVSLSDAGNRGNRTLCRPARGLRCAAALRQAQQKGPQTIIIDFTHPGDEMPWYDPRRLITSVDKTTPDTVRLGAAFVAQSETLLSYLGAVPPPLPLILYGCWANITREVHLKFNYSKDHPAAGRLKVSVLQD